MQRLFNLERVDIIILELSALTARYGGGEPDISKTLTSQVIIGGKGIAGLAYRRRQIVTTDNYWLDSTLEHTPELDAQVRRVEGVALIAMPISLDDEVVGILAGIKGQAY